MAAVDLPTVPVAGRSLEQQYRAERGDAGDMRRMRRQEDRQRSLVLVRSDAFEDSADRPSAEDADADAPPVPRCKKV